MSYANNSRASEIIEKVIKHYGGAGLVRINLRTVEEHTVTSGAAWGWSTRQSSRYVEHACMALENRTHKFICVEGITGESATSALRSSGLAVTPLLLASSPKLPVAGISQSRPEQFDQILSTNESFPRKGLPHFDTVVITRRRRGVRNEEFYTYTNSGRVAHEMRATYFDQCWVKVDHPLEPADRLVEGWAMNPVDATKLMRTQLTEINARCRTNSSNLVRYLPKELPAMIITLHAIRRLLEKAQPRLLEQITDVSVALNFLDLPRDPANPFKRYYDDLANSTLDQHIRRDNPEVVSRPGYIIDHQLRRTSRHVAVAAVKSTSQVADKNALIVDDVLFPPTAGMTTMVTVLGRWHNAVVIAPISNFWRHICRNVTSVDDDGVWWPSGVRSSTLNLS